MYVLNVLNAFICRICKKNNQDFNFYFINDKNTTGSANYKTVVPTIATNNRMFERLEENSRLPKLFFHCTCGQLTCGRIAFDDCLKLQILKIKLEFNS